MMMMSGTRSLQPSAESCQRASAAVAVAAVAVAAVVEGAAVRRRELGRSEIVMRAMVVWSAPQRSCCGTCHTIAQDDIQGESGMAADW